MNCFKTATEKERKNLIKKFFFLKKKKKKLGNFCFIDNFSRHLGGNVVRKSFLSLDNLKIIPSYYSITIKY